MKLFTFATSPYARKARMVLEYKGIECEMVERCYSLDRKPDLREASERAEVPVLVLDDGRTIADSTIICEYLEDAHPSPPVFPADPFERARMRAIDDLCDRTFDATVFGYFLGLVRSTAPESKAMQDAGRAEFKALLARLEHELEGRDFFCGAALSLADFAAICHPPVAHAMRLPMNEFPRAGGLGEADARDSRWSPPTSSARARRWPRPTSPTSSRGPTAVSIGATAGWNGRCVMALSISLRANSMQVR